MINKDFSKERLNSASKQIHQSDPRSQPVLLPFLKLYNFIIGSGAIPVRLLFYRNIGERSISFLAWIISLSVHIYYVFFYAIGFSLAIAYIVLWFTDSVSQLDQIANDVDFLGWFNLLFILFNGVSIYLIRCFLIEGWKHFLSNSKKPDALSSVGSYKRGDPIFSNKEDYLGKTKWTFLGKKVIDEDSFKVLIEPQKIFFFGLVVTILFSVLPFLVITFYDGLISSVIAIFLLSYNSVGVLISLSAICLFLEEKGIEQRILYAALDIVDGQHDLERVLIKRDELIGHSNKTTRTTKRKSFPIVKIT